MRFLTICLAVSACLAAFAVITDVWPNDSEFTGWKEVNQEVETVFAASAQGTELTEAADEGHPLKVNVNRATREQLETLPGIGPAKASAILAYRETNGPFRTVEQILEVKGIGPKILEKLRPHIEINDASMTGNARIAR